MFWIFGGILVQMFEIRENFAVCCSLYFFLYFTIIVLPLSKSMKSNACFWTIKIILLFNTIGRFILLDLSRKINSKKFHSKQDARSAVLFKSFRQTVISSHISKMNYLRYNQMRSGINQSKNEKNDQLKLNYALQFFIV